MPNAQKLPTPRGVIESEYYLNDHVISRFRDICGHLQEDFEMEMNCKDLAILSMDLQNFMHENLGPDNPSQQVVMTRIPASYFRDMSYHGSLYLILKECIKYKQQMHWNEFSFHKKSSYDDNIALLLSIEEELLNENQLKMHKVFFSPDVPTEKLAELEKIVAQHNGEVILSDKDADFIVYYDPILDTADSTCNEMRIIEMSELGDFVLAHWRFYPDSYDQWIPQRFAGEAQVFDVVDGKTRQVCCRFIKDLGMYNEWMNPVDYCVLLDDKKNAKKLQKKHKKHKKKKRKRAEDEGDSAEDVAAYAMQILDKHSTNLIETHVYNNLVSGNNGPAGVGVPDPRISSFEKTIVIPSCSKWFNNNSISPLEKRMLPEFFNQKSPSKNPQVYLQYRNYMIQVYRQDPSVPLTATVCRRNLAGDACAIVRVHEFLEHWGLINFQVDMSQDEIETSITRSELESCLEQKYVDDSYANPFVCSQCKKECSSVRYELKNNDKDHPIKEEKKWVVCVSCMKKEQLPSSLKIEDFCRKENNTTWTEEELDKLIKGIDQGGNQEDCDWDQISEFIGTKSKIQCMNKFMEYRFEKDPSSHGSSASLMTHIEKMVSLVHPDVATRAAKAATAEICRQNGTTYDFSKDLPSNIHQATDAMSTSLSSSGYSKCPSFHDDSVHGVGASVTAATALAAVAVKGNEIVHQEEEEIKNLMSTLLNAQVKRIELKMLQMEALEKAVIAEREQLVRDRYDLYVERLKLATNL